MCILNVELDTEYCQTDFNLNSYYPSQNTLYLQLQCSHRLQCTGFGVHMLRVLLNHPDFTFPTGAPWKACQILGEHISSASYMYWHQMYSRTMVQAETIPGSRTVRSLINILKASCWTTFSISSSRSTAAFLSLSSHLTESRLIAWLLTFDKAYSDNSGEAVFQIQCRWISVCLEVIRPDFSPHEKSNTPKGQKKRLQSMARHFHTNRPCRAWTTFMCLVKTQNKTVSNPFQLSFMERMACKRQCKWLFLTMWVRLWDVVHTRAGWGLRRGGSASASAAPSGPSPGQWWGSWGRNTQTDRRHKFGGPYPCKMHAAIQPLKCNFFREMQPQFIPTNGSLHKSKSYSCLNGCTAHMYTLIDRHTARHKHKQKHKELCRGKRDQLPLQAW